MTFSSSLLSVRCQQRQREKTTIGLFRGAAVIRFLGLATLLLGSISSSHASTNEHTADQAAVPRTVSGFPRLRSLLLAPPDEAEAKVVRAVYERTNSTLLWSLKGEPTQQARAVIGILSMAATFGLEPDDYAADLLARSVLQPKRAPSQMSEFDILLTRAVLRFISHVHYGRIDPRAAGFELAQSRNDLDVAATVAALASGANVDEMLATVEPHFYHYALLKSALSFYHHLAGDPNITKLPLAGNHTFHLGEPYSGVPALRALLIAERDLPTANAPKDVEVHREEIYRRIQAEDSREAQD